MSPSMAADTACYPSSTANALPLASASSATSCSKNLAPNYSHGSLPAAAPSIINNTGSSAGFGQGVLVPPPFSTVSNGSGTFPNLAGLGVQKPIHGSSSNVNLAKGANYTTSASAAATNGSSINRVMQTSMSHCNGQSSQSNYSAVCMAAQAPEVAGPPQRPSLWFEEDLGESLRWSFGLKRILHTGASKFQDIALLDTEPFGKVLTLDRRMQSAEIDEWVYHECLVHPALLLHQGPRSIFIAGGGEGSTARECLLHKSVRKVVMCDIDEEVVKFCSAHLTINKEAFQSNKLELVIADAKAELERREERFDVIIGDLADPLEWGPCYTLYCQGFYQDVVKPRLNPNGIFVTQAGPAGVLSHREVFTSIYNTLKSVFSYVVAYSTHVPSYCDVWGWVVASDQPLMSHMSSEELDRRITQRIKGGKLRYLDGLTLYASTILNRTVRESLEKEKHVYTEESARFVYGQGRSTNCGTH